MLDFHIFDFLCEKTFLIIEIFLVSSSLTVVPLFLINIYSDSFQTTLKYFKNTEANTNNVLVMTGYFNIRDNSWDTLFPHYFSHCNILTDIANSFNLYISKYTNQVPTRYLDNQNNSNLVINLMFL